MSNKCTCGGHAVGNLHSNWCDSLVEEPAVTLGFYGKYPVADYLKHAYESFDNQLADMILESVFKIGPTRTATGIEMEWLSSIHEEKE